MFPAAVERWRAAARDIGARRGIPEAWILATIRNESRGVPGLPGSSGELGLMQTMPDVITRYNAINLSAQVSRAEMAGTTAHDGAQQIKVGAWYLDHLCRELNKEDPDRFPAPFRAPPDDQILFADLAFAAGRGALNKQRAAAAAAGLPDTFDGLRAAKGPIPDRKFGHAERCLAWTRADQAQGGELAPARPPQTATAPQPSAGGGAAILAIAAILAFAAAKASGSFSSSSASQRRLA